MESDIGTADHLDEATVDDRQSLADHLWAMSTSTLATFALCAADLHTDSAN